jgi:drug/metabolite transporter (DMT)-like permease
VSDRSSWTNWLLFLALAFMWGSAYLFIKIGVQTLTPLTLIATRLAIGTAVLATVVAVAREPLPRDLRMYGHLAVLSVLGIVIPFFLITSAEQTTDSSLAAIINGAIPLFAVVIAALALHDEPITLDRSIGLLIGFVGVVVLVGGGLASIRAGGSLYGEVALVGSSICYAAAPVYARRFIKGLRPMIPAAFEIGFAFVITTVLAFALERPLATQVRPDAIFAVVWLGLLGSGLAYIAFFRLVGHWGATRTALVAYLLPVVGIALGVIVLRERIDARTLLGTVLIIGGVALVNSRSSLRRLLSAPR